MVISMEMSWVNTLTGVLPLAIIVIYIAPIIFVVWWAITMVKLQRERNMILHRIAGKLSYLSYLEDKETFR